MMKTELVAQVANRAGVPVTKTEKVLNEFMELVKDTVANGEEVVLRDFGAFKISHKAARQGRNIALGTQITIPAHDAVVFKPSKCFKDAMWHE